MKKLLFLIVLLLPLFVFSAGKNDSSNVVKDSAALAYFKKQGITVDSSADSLYFYLYSWIGVHYHYAGYSRKGIDCSGLVKKVFGKYYNIKLSGSARDIYHECRKKVKKKKLKQGDLIFFKIGKNKHISHIGIYLNHHKFIHASVHSGVTVSDLNDTYYKKYFYKASRVR